MACKALDIYYLALYRKRLLNTGLAFSADNSSGLGIRCHTSCKVDRSYSTFNAISLDKFLTLSTPNTKNDLEEESHNYILMHSPPYLRPEKMSSK